MPCYILVASLNVKNKGPVLRIFQEERRKQGHQIKRLTVIDLFCREDSANDEEAVQVKEKLLVRVHANSRASECPAVWGQDIE